MMFSERIIGLQGMMFLQTQYAFTFPNSES